MELSYSTDPGWCARCKHLPCICKKAPLAGKAQPPTKGSRQVKMRREVRRGKPVTVIFETPMNESALKDLLQTLQRSCGAGGSTKDGSVEIQGDHRDKAEQILVELGFKVRRSGG